MLRARLATMSASDQTRFYEGYYRALAGWQRLRFAMVKEPAGGWPILFNMSFPKSGTNLMSQVLSGFSRVAPFVYHTHARFAAFDFRTGASHTEREALDFLDHLRPRDLATAHMPAFPAVVQRVCSSSFIPYFIFRDPRDVVVSHAFYIAEMAGSHHLHSYYSERLHSFDERLATSILGSEDTGVDFPNIARRFEIYADWLNHPEVLSVRYEQFADGRKAVLISIVEHFLKRVDTLQAYPDQLVGMLEDGIDPRRSVTFRSGRIGEWREYFKPEHKDLFKSVAGDLVIRLGYESDNSW